MVLIYVCAFLAFISSVWSWSPAIHRTLSSATISKVNHTIIKAIADRIEETSSWKPGITYIEMGANNGAWTDSMMNKIKEEGKSAR